MNETANSRSQNWNLIWSVRLLVNINKILEKKAIMVESEHYNDINNFQLSVGGLTTAATRVFPLSFSLYISLRDRYALLRTFQYEFAIKVINQIFSLCGLINFLVKCPSNWHVFLLVKAIYHFSLRLYVRTLFCPEGRVSYDSPPLKLHIILY